MRQGAQTTSEIAKGATVVLGLLNLVRDEEHFAREMTRLCRALWTKLRPDDFPSPRAFAEHVAGVPATDGAALIARIMDHPKTDGTDHTAEIVAFPSPDERRVN